MGWIKHFLKKFWAIICFIWKLFKPLRNLITKFLLWYKKLWQNFTYTKYGEIIYKKCIIMSLITLVVIIVIPTAILLVLQTTYYLSTYKKDSIYLSQSEEIYPDDNIWGVRGCYNKVCDSNSSLYFRIKPTLFNHIWNITHNGNLFLPDMVGSSVPTGSTKCEIISYGLRIKILMMFNIYPSILEIHCEN